MNTNTISNTAISYIDKFALSPVFQDNVLLLTASDYLLSDMPQDKGTDDQQTRARIQLNGIKKGYPQLYVKTTPCSQVRVLPRHLTMSMDRSVHDKRGNS